MGTVKGQATGFSFHPENINRAGGPPKTHWWSQLLIDRANEEDKLKKLKNKEVMADALIEKAKTGDIQAIKEFGDRVQGKAPQGLGMIDDDGAFQEQNITVVFKEAKSQNEPE